MRAVLDETAFAYDEVDYPTSIDAELTPDHVRAVGLLHGWDAPVPATASFLEIGCFDGLNAIGVAAVWPLMRCVGIDLAGEAIRRGQQLAAAAGIGNVELLHENILTFPRDGEKFDYIVCHGVYSWVPEDVRDPLLELISARLAPGGVAYLGYDSLPGCASKYAINRFLQGQVTRIGELDGRLAETQRLIAVLDRNQSEASRLKPQVDNLVENFPKYDPNYVFHDWLVPEYRPTTVTETAAHAAQFGLQHVADCSLGDFITYDLDADAQQLLAGAGDYVARAELIAVLRGTRMFRADLLIRSDAPPPPASDPYRRLGYSHPARRVPSEESDDGAARYDAGQSFLITRELDIIAVIEAMAAAAPNEVSFEQLRAATGLEPAALVETLERLVRRGAVHAHSTPQPFTTTPGNLPRAGRLVLHMLEVGNSAVTLRHRPFTATDQPARLFISLCDGMRSRAEIARLMGKRLGAEVAVQQVDSAIANLAELGLFEA